MRPAVLLTCAECGRRPCLCLEEWIQLRRAAALLREVAAGRADVAGAAVWLERNLQSETEEAAIIHARRELRRMGLRGIADAMEFVAGVYPVQRPEEVGGTDETIKEVAGRYLRRVRLEHVTAARHYVTRGWLGRRHRGPFVGLPGRRITPQNRGGTGALSRRGACR